jgi:integrase
MRKSGNYGTGRIFQQSYKDRSGRTKHSKRYHIAYPKDGEEIREKTGTTVYKDALQLLKDRLAGKLPDQPAAAAFTIETLIALVKKDYKQEGRTSLDTLERSRFPHLRSHFVDRDISKLKRRDMKAYRDKRLEAGAANNSVNHDIETLHRGLQIAFDDELISAVPRLKKLQDNSTRRGFFEWADFQTVLSHVDPWWQELYTVAYITGWRVDSEICPLRWAQVDFVHKVLRLEPGTTKNGEGRNFGFTPNLEKAFVAQRAKVRQLEKTLGRVIPYVFPAFKTHAKRAKGMPLTSAYKPFKKAAKAAGFADAIPHNFRRTAIRNLEFAGVDRPTAKKMVGHKTDSVYERYAIVDKRKLDHGTEKLSAYEAFVTANAAAVAAAAEEESRQA